jgi:uncharacterized membrane protein (DUF441 family)
MNEIRRIAKIYFEEFEGFHLYTKPKTGLFYIWLIAIVAMLATNAATVILLSKNAPDWYSILALASDVFAALISQSLAKQRNSRIQLIMKTRDGFSFDSLESCKKSRLSSLLGVRPEKFLESADEICRMKEILAQLDPMSSKSIPQIVFRYIYDSRSKDRLLNLGLVFVGVTVTLAATGQANLENLFEAFSNDSFWSFLALLEMLAIVGFLLWILVHTLWFSSSYFFGQWCAKLSRAKFGGNTEVEYMVCDLVRLHRRPPLFHTQ